MSTFIVVGFKKDVFRASEVLNNLVELDYDWTIDLDEAVATYRDYKGKLRIDVSYPMTTGEGAALGDLLGSLVGLTLGPIAALFTTGVVGCAALGTAGGALDATWWNDDFGIPDDFAQDVGKMVQPGDSAIFTLLRSTDPTLVAGRFIDYGGVVLSTTLTREQAEKVEEILMRSDM